MNLYLDHEKQTLWTAPDSLTSFRQIPLYRLKNDTGILYRCSIAFQLEQKDKRWHCAQEILNIIAQFSPEIPSPYYSPRRFGQQNLFPASLQFRVQLVEPGWIDLHLSDRSLATWLQHLIDLPNIAIERNSENSDSLFPLQYAHSRCCSLLRLGHQQQIIQLYNQDLSQSTWQWAKPNPIPWFSSSDQTRLCLIHPREKFLMIQLLEIVDQFEHCLENAQNSTLDWVKLGMNLSAAVLNFYDHCRIWGEIQTMTPEQSQAKLALISLTQWVLRWLLEVQLKSVAPLEL